MGAPRKDKPPVEEVPPVSPNPAPVATETNSEE